MLKPGVILYFVRHGETDWNAAKRYQGQRDIPLNATGRAQAARNGRALAAALGESAHALDYVASPLKRACETMEIVRRELGLAPSGYHNDDRLKEMHYGHWEGQLWDDLPATDPEGFAARKADAWSWQPHGGESYGQLSRRIACWLQEISRDSVVVAHGGVSRALRGLVLRLPEAEIPFLAVPQDKVLVIETGRIGWL
ncbi:MAG: histidine phosphatase family protein [Hyphomicrobiaceae bacterium]|nr:MAG: histidine phosphatase family protein [Hyphomicrobiaceae bacterium]